MAGAVTASPVPEVRVSTSATSADGVATVAGSALAALALTWVLYERVLPFSGVLGFWLAWYLVFVLIYAAMATMQWDRLDPTNRVTSVLFGTAGALALAIVVAVASYSLVKGWAAVRHVSFLTTSMQLSG